jgi:molybdopterin synthase catalytic subunit
MLDGAMIKIVKEKIDVDEVIESVRDPGAGGIDVFLGTTRNHADGKKVFALEYEAYDPMALKMMLQIADDIKSKWNVCKISIVHRTGRVEIGEASVVIAVSSAHRKEAFEACRYAIDTLKKTVPIWKKEFFADGEVWVGSQSGDTRSF